MKEKIKSLATEIHDEVIAIRRHIHQHPELSFKEFHTSAYIQQRLDDIGVPYETGFVKTGILGIIKGKNPDKITIALRADMDALPIEEKNNVPYVSINQGIMHACGHDAHSAMLLGVAKILYQLKDFFEGTIILVFQPGEELLPGGAKLLLEEGIFSVYKPDYIIAQHVLPSIDAGKTGFKEGMYMASSDEIYLTVHGKGGHAALPDEYNNPILIASRILSQLNEYFSMAIRPPVPTILSFGKFMARGATNVVPDKVDIEGTFRTLDEEWRAECHRKVREMAGNIASDMGGRCQVEIKKGYPVLVNHEGFTRKLKKAAEDILGEKNVEEMDIRMSSEDFAYYSRQYPSCFYRLGIRHPGKKQHPSLHTATFDIDEQALLTGMVTMSWLAINALQSNEK